MTIKEYKERFVDDNLSGIVQVKSCMTGRILCQNLNTYKSKSIAKVENRDISFITSEIKMTNKTTNRLVQSIVVLWVYGQMGD